MSEWRRDAVEQLLRASQEARRRHMLPSMDAGTLFFCDLDTMERNNRKGRKIEMEIIEKKTYTITMGEQEKGTIEEALRIAKSHIEQEADGLDRNSEEWKRLRLKFSDFLDIIHKLQ